MLRGVGFRVWDLECWIGITAVAFKVSCFGIYRVRGGCLKLECVENSQQYRQEKNYIYDSGISVFRASGCSSRGTTSISTCCI